MEIIVLTVLATLAVIFIVVPVVTGVLIGLIILNRVLRFMFGQRKHKKGGK